MTRRATWGATATAVAVTADGGDDHGHEEAEQGAHGVLEATEGLPGRVGTAIRADPGRSQAG